MSNLSDNDIKKALEQCKNVVMHDCKNCFYHKEYNGKCVVMLARDALDLINRLTEQNEGLQEEVAIKTDMLNRQQAEIERLREERDFYKAPSSLLAKGIEKIKSEAIKEFAERLKQEIQESKYRLNDSPYARACNQVADWCIEVSNNLVKEMTEQ